MRTARITEEALHRKLNYMLPSMAEKQDVAAYAGQLVILRYLRRPCGGWMVVGCRRRDAANDCPSPSPLFPRTAA